jgi:hypothetical protein
MNLVVMELAPRRALCVSRFLVTKQASSRASRAPTGLRCLVRLRISQGMAELQIPGDDQARHAGRAVIRLTIGRGQRRLGLLCVKG